MKISLLENGFLNIISNNEKIRIKHAFCAVSWNDDSGILYRFDSYTAKMQNRRNAASTVYLRFIEEACPEMEWEITERRNTLLLRLSVINTTGRNIKLKTLEPFGVSQPQAGNININGKLNQAGMLSLPRVGGNIKPRYLWEKLYSSRLFSSSMAACLYNKSTESAFTLGFVTTADMFGEIMFEFDAFRNLKEFSAFCNAEGLTLKPGAKLSSEELFINIEDTASKGLDSYALKLREKMNCKPVLKPVTGWSTWDYYFGNISEENILENVDFLARHKQEIPMEYIQIDAGYTVDKLYEWENWNERFPHGPKWLVKKINEKGFKAGLWLVPFWACRGSVLAERHPDWLIKDKNGNALSPAESSFALDGTHPEVRKYLRDLARTITCDWGFEYIKIDGASMIGMTEGIHYDLNATSCQAYRRGIEAFRAGMKSGTYFMGGIFGPSIGIVDAMRIGSDVGARWDGSKTDIHAGERDRYHGCGNITRAISSSLNTAFMNKRLWSNDGDYLVVRDDCSELSLSEARTWATVTGLYGGSVILSDRMATLSQPRLEILKKIFPVNGITAVPVDFLKKDIPEILAADITINNDSWKIAALFNYSDFPALKTLSFTDIGLDPRKEYHVFGFWKQKYHGAFMNSVSLPLEAHSCEVMAIRENKHVPQLLGTDIHISQGKAEIETVQFKDNALVVKTAKLGRTGNIFVFVPDDFVPDGGLIKHAANVWKSETRLDGGSVKYRFRKKTEME
ncbi:MAG: alpha-galactosidase [Victivallaceae bacterium]|nr:alpha-galactosidase [Victivallaceae bacterium]